MKPRRRKVCFITVYVFRLQDDRLRRGVREPQAGQGASTDGTVRQRRRLLPGLPVTAFQAHERLEQKARI